MGSLSKVKEEMSVTCSIEIGTKNGGLFFGQLEEPTALGPQTAGQEIFKRIKDFLRTYLNNVLEVSAS